MVYTYTPAGRLESEVREGQVWYSGTTGIIWMAVGRW